MFQLKIPSSTVFWYLERKPPCTLRKLVTLYLYCDILVQFIKRFFNKSKKCMTRLYPTFSHFSFSRSQLCRNIFSTDWDAEGKKKEKMAYFVFSYALFFSKEEKNFILLLILSGKGLTREFQHLLFSHGYYFHLSYLPVFITPSSQ